MLQHLALHNYIDKNASGIQIMAMFEWHIFDRNFLLIVK
jgi:hypothetical protein